MSGLELEPKSPKRLWISAEDFIQEAKIPEGSDAVLLTVNVWYNPWCCNGVHEVTDGIDALRHLIEGETE